MGSPTTIALLALASEPTASAVGICDASSKITRSKSPFSAFKYCATVIGLISIHGAYGKGVVQSVYDLKDGTCLKITVSEYFTPNGRTIHGEGVTPDVEIEYKADLKNPDKDNQLESAVKVIKDKLK